MFCVIPPPCKGVQNNACTATITLQGLMFEVVSWLRCWGLFVLLGCANYQHHEVEGGGGGGQLLQRGWPGQPAPSLPGARATPAQPASGGGCLPQPRWAVCATGAGAHQGQTSREGEKDTWWTARTTCGGTGHLGLTHTARQATDGLWTEARGQQKQPNDQHILNTPTTGRR